MTINLLHGFRIARIIAFLLLAVIAVLASIAINESLTYGFCKMIGRVNYARDEYFSWVASFVEQHRDEPDFTFRIRNQPPEVDRLISLKEGYATDPVSPVKQWRES